MRSSKGMKTSHLMLCCGNRIEPELNRLGYRVSAQWVCPKCGKQKTVFVGDARAEFAQ